MSDRDVERELKENRQRDRERERREEDDGPIVDTAEAAIDPLVNVLREPAEEEDLESRREANDEAQRPDP